MNSSRLLAPSTALAVCCQVSGYAALRMTPEQLPVLRRNPGSAPRLALPPSLLKHADPQTVAGLAAVLQAIHQHGLSGVCFREWGAIAGPALLGRQASADSMQRFREEGAFAISPHLVPHESLHSVSGTVSQALALQGSNFGVGGGPGAAEEALLVAATLFADGTLPGLWLILTGFDPELIPVADEADPPEHSWICHAVALALTPSAGAEGLCLRIGLGNLSPTHGTEPVPFRLERFAAAIGSASGAPCVWRLRLGGWVCLGP